MKMSRTFLFAAVFVLLLAATGSAQNLVNNPGMESWTVNGAAGPPDDWALSSGSMSATQESTTVQSGSYSASVTWTTTSTANMEQIFSGVTGGSSYEVSFWAFDNDPAGRVRLYGYWQNASGNTGSAVDTSYTTDSASWQELSTGSLTAPIDATGFSYEIRFYDVGANWDGDATIYIDDVSLAQPAGAPEITNAYSTSDDEVVVVFNMDVDQTTAETAGNYSLDDGSNTVTFSSAVRGPTTTVTLSGASSTAVMGDTTLDTLTVTGVQADGGGTSSNTTSDFYAGVSPIANIQQTGVSGGYNFTVRGVISGNDDYSDVWIADASGGWNGALIFDYSFHAAVSVGDDVTIVGEVTEYNTLTEITDPVLVTTHSTGNTPYGPTVVTCADLDSTYGDDNATAEPYEGVLVTINSAECLSAQDGSYESLVSDNGGTNQTVIDDDAYYHLDFGMTVGEIYDITGLVMYKSGQYKVCPRDTADIVLVSPVNHWDMY